MFSKWSKKQWIHNLRIITQILGIILTIIGLFVNVPFIMSAFLVVAIIMGPVFCGWVCPFGTIQDMMSRLSRRLGIKRRVMPKAIHKYLVYLRYVFLAISILVSADFIFTILNQDPRANLTSALLGYSLSIFGWIVIVVFTGLSVFFDRPFCNYFCIEGAKYGLFSALRPITIIRNKETCIGCNKCNKSCPMNIDIANNGQVRSLQCIDCLSCVADCPVEKTLEIKPMPIRKRVQQVIVPVFFIVTLGLSVYVFAAESNTSLIDQVVAENILNPITSITNAASSDASDSVEASGNASGLYDGVYTGTGSGFRGDIDVEITVEDGIITDVEVTDQSEDYKWYSRAYSGVVSEILDEQSADVDTVSGATYSSNGIIEAVEEAIEKAKLGDDSATITTSSDDSTSDSSSDTSSNGYSSSDHGNNGSNAGTGDGSGNNSNSDENTSSSVDTSSDVTSDTSDDETSSDETVEDIIVSTNVSGYADGVYTGTGRGFRGDITVEVTISNGTITGVEVISENEDYEWYSRAFSGVVPDILDAQSAEVDTVSGATYSSRGIIDAVEAALADALSNASSSSSATTSSSSSTTDNSTSSESTISDDGVTNNDTSTSDAPTSSDTATSSDDSTSSGSESSSSDTSESVSIDSSVVADLGDAQGIADGVYSGSGTGFRGSVYVDVTVKDEVITSVEVTSYSDDYDWFQRALSGVVSQILSEQTANVDVVSGASFSSIGIMEAVEDALTSAGGTNVEAVEAEATGGGHGGHGGGPGHH